MVYPSHRFLKLLGVLYLLGAAFAFLSGRPLKFLHRQLNASQRENLNRWAALMWRFYEDFCTEQEHFLPPDNMQQAPVYKIAHRTSPTNIGFYLLSCLAARDLHFMDSCALATRIENTLATVEKLPKYHGNLYNWYDTQTLAILQPAFVSCVDSGNFVGLLVALKEGLKEYRKEDARIDGLIKRIETIVCNTDLGLFYNKAKKLFSIGYDVQSDSFSQSYYDFLMSEARLTSYFAVATHQAPKKHWGRLSRTMARQNAYAGAMSWTGTMFEYFMPHILLPVHEGTLLFEALRFCLHCQKQRVKGKGVPWGISESAFYSFDNQLNYQYKAHGVQKLGLKRGLDQELVVSPYSSLLTLPYDFTTATTT